MKIDLKKLAVYVDMGMSMPIWGKPLISPPFWYSNGGFPPYPQPSAVEPPAPDTTYDRIKERITRLMGVAPATVQKPSPDFVHTLTGWRGWAIDCGKLQALGTELAWNPRQAPPAHCIYNDHQAPLKECQCGYWSFKSLELLTQALEAYSRDVEVIGTVELWGKVIECENGFRSEYAYPKELWALDSGMEWLSWSYGVPIRTMGERK